MVLILLLTIIACVEKLDEKDDIIMACVDVPVHYVVTIMCHLCHCTHCMCDCTLRLRPTDHAPLMWLRPGQSQATAAAAWQSLPLIGHSDAASRPHWPIADSPVLEQALREMRLRTLFQDEDCKKGNNPRASVCLFRLFTHMLLWVCQRWTNT